MGESRSLSSGSRIGVTKITGSGRGVGVTKITGSGSRVGVTSENARINFGVTKFYFFAHVGLREIGICTCTTVHLCFDLKVFDFTITMNL